MAKIIMLIVTLLSLAAAIFFANHGPLYVETPRQALQLAKYPEPPIVTYAREVSVVHEFGDRAAIVHRQSYSPSTEGIVEVTIARRGILGWTVDEAVLMGIQPDMSKQVNFSATVIRRSARNIPYPEPNSEELTHYLFFGHVNDESVNEVRLRLSNEEELVQQALDGLFVFHQSLENVPCQLIVGENKIALRSREYVILMLDRIITKRAYSEC